MTLQEYADHLNQHLKENPEHGKLQAVYSSDDEGNSYHPVIYGPGLVGQYQDREFTSSKDDESITPNAVCIN